jgi:hypothetical protein
MVVFFVVGVGIGSSMLSDTRSSDEDLAQKKEFQKEFQSIKAKLADMEHTNEELLLKLDDTDTTAGPVINLDDIHVGADEYQPAVLDPAPPAVVEEPVVVELMPARVSTARPLKSIPEPQPPPSLREWDQGQTQSNKKKAHKTHKLKRRGPKVPAAQSGGIQVRKGEERKGRGEERRGEERERRGKGEERERRGEERERRGEERERKRGGGAYPATLTEAADDNCCSPLIPLLLSATVALYQELPMEAIDATTAQAARRAMGGGGTVDLDAHAHPPIKLNPSANGLEPLEPLDTEGAVEWDQALVVDDIFSAFAHGDLAAEETPRVQVESINSILYRGCR